MSVTATPPPGTPAAEALGGYFDSASAAPLHPAAGAALLAALAEGWADPQRRYRAARRARVALDAARETVAAAVGALPDEVVFCGSGTQAAQLALLGGLSGRHRVGRHLVVSAVEHSCVLHAADWHAAAGGRVTRVGVDETGLVAPAEFAAALRPDTALASLQTANHEVGSVQPVREVAAACAAAGVPVHVDAAQSVGRVPVDVTELGADLLTASAHKWGGPPGVGVLVVRTGTRWRAPVPDGDREHGRVGGFENVPAVVAAAAALHARQSEMQEEADRLTRLVDRLRRELPRRVPDLQLLGHPELRLPHLVAFCCLYVSGEALLDELDREGFAVSSGSSCTSDTLTPSHVLVAMGAVTHGNVRVSLHGGVPPAEVDRFLRVLPAVVARLRQPAGASRGDPR